MTNKQRYYRDFTLLYEYSQQLSGFAKDMEKLYKDYDPCIEEELYLTLIEGMWERMEEIKDNLEDLLKQF